MTARCVPPTLLALTALLSACSKPAVESYRVPKEVAAQPAATKSETPAAAPAEPKARPLASAPVSASPTIPPSGTSAAPAPAAPPSMANTPVATASGADLAWTAPAHWKAKTLSAMRKGSYGVPGDAGEADLSISAFPGSVGGELPNLNRWRGQVDLPPTTQAEYESSRQVLQHNGLKMIVVDIASPGPNARRILGAMIAHGDATWFVKMGPAPDATVAKEKSVFLAFLETVKPATK